MNNLSIFIITSVFKLIQHIFRKDNRKAPFINYTWLYVHYCHKSHTNPHTQITRMNRVWFTKCIHVVMMYIINGRTARTAAQVVRTDAFFFLNGCRNPFEQAVILTGRIPERLARLLMSFERMLKPFERIASRSNGWRTASKRNSIRKRELVSVRFPVEGRN